MATAEPLSPEEEQARQEFGTRVAGLYQYYARLDTVELALRLRQDMLYEFKTTMRKELDGVQRRSFWPNLWAELRPELALSHVRLRNLGTREWTPLGNALNVLQTGTLRPTKG